MTADAVTVIAVIAALLGILTAVLTGIRRTLLMVDGYVGRRIASAVKEALGEFAQTLAKVMDDTYVNRREYEVHKEHDTEMHVRLDGEVDLLWSRLNVQAKAAKS